MKSLRLLIAAMLLWAAPAFAQIHTFQTDQATWNSFVACFNNLQPTCSPGGGPLNTLPPQTANYNAQGFTLFNLAAAVASGQPIVYGQTLAALTSLTASVNNVLTVTAPPYNAVCDGVTDDTTAIQNALYDACGVPRVSGVPTPAANVVYVATNPVLVPPCASTYFHSQPLRIVCQNLNISGAGKLSQNYTGYALMQESYGVPGQIALTGSPITGPGGNLPSTDGALSKWIDLSEQLNGNGSAKSLMSGCATGCNIAVYEGWNGGTGGNQVIGSHPAYPGSGNGGFGITLNSGTGVHTVTVNFSGSGLVSTACPAQTGNTTLGYEIEADWTTSTLKVWQGVPGNTASLCGSTSITGHIVVGPTEEMLLPDGGPTQYLLDQSSNSDNAFDGALYAIRFKGESFHQSAYTIPTSKFGTTGNPNDGYELYWNNFETTGTDGTSLGYSNWGGLTNSYLPIQGGGYNIYYTSGLTMTGMNLCSRAHFGSYGFDINEDGLFATGGNNSSYVDNICGDGNDPDGWVPWNFAGNNFFTIAYGNNSYGGVVGANMNSGWNHSTYQNNSVDGTNYACVTQGGGGLSTDGWNNCTNRGPLFYDHIMNSTQGQVDNDTIDGELTDTNWQANFLLNDPQGAFLFNTGTFTGQNGVPFVLQDNGGVAPIFNGSTFSVQVGTPNYLLQFTNGNPTGFALMDHIYNPSNIPISNLLNFVDVLGATNRLNGSLAVPSLQFGTIYSVAGTALPAASASNKYTAACVSDSVACNSFYVGSGSMNCHVHSIGSAWQEDGFGC